MKSRLKKRPLDLVACKSKFGIRMRNQLSVGEFMEKYFLKCNLEVRRLQRN